MAKYVNRTDALTRLEDELICYGYISMETGCDVVKSLPTVEIIHCSECRRADWQPLGNGLAYCYCMAHGHGGLKGDDYCSYGEKEESNG